MSAKPAITIVGPGNLGSALAISLQQAGYRIREIVWGESRSSAIRARRLARQLRARAVGPEQAHWGVRVVWLCVPDRAIAKVAHILAPLTSWKGKIVLHSSGALGSDELKSLRRLGAATASLHPLMTFIRDSRPSLQQVPFAAEGDRAAIAVARQIVRDLKGEMFLIPRPRKPAYHTWGAFISPLLVTALVTAEQVARAAGISPAAARKRMLPIVVQTLRNYAAHGPARALSGPLVRGDTATVAKHLQVLKKIPQAREVYLALTRSALQNLPARNRRALERVLRN
jgi:predicted short-subunit dehydrogenase-like oxidoreductase (DUF2520 family)